MVTNRISLHHLNLTPLIHPELENLQRPSAHQLTSLTKFDETKKSTPPKYDLNSFGLVNYISSFTPGETKDICCKMMVGSDDELSFLKWSLFKSGIEIFFS